MAKKTIIFSEEQVEKIEKEAQNTERDFSKTVRVIIDLYFKNSDKE